MDWKTAAVVAVNRKLVLAAFADLRKFGMICRANFSCCMNCAGTEIANDVDKMPVEKRAEVVGAVFWHRQDEEHLASSGKLMIAYGPVTVYKVGTFGGSVESVGKLVAAALAQKGLVVTWDGNGDTRIEVDLTRDVELARVLDERNWKVAKSKAFSASA